MTVWYFLTARAMALNHVCAYGSSPAARALVKPFLFSRLLPFLGGLKAMWLVHLEKCTCGPCAGCADLPQLLEASGTAECRVTVVQSQTRGLAGWRNK